MDPNRFASLLLSMVPFLLAITVHEVAHGYIAYRKGDYTAKLMGRITMNPIRHLDPVGSVLFPLLLAFSGAGVIFGWAKPVPVNSFNFRSPRRDMMHVSLAGPLSNFLLAMALALVFRILLWVPGPEILWSNPILQPLSAMIVMGIKISIYLGVFNLLPIHPLDGSHILEGLLPAEQARAYSRLSRYGWIVLVVLLFSGMFHIIIDPAYRFIFTIITRIFGI
ncbi:MAG: site-2 protease family protein [bacterium]|nr:site-2 protease family protein [bacterium]MDT8396393.1 site-2 protease family protein [bacterium]